MRYKVWICDNFFRDLGKTVWANSIDTQLPSGARRAHCLHWIHVSLIGQSEYCFNNVSAVPFIKRRILRKDNKTFSGRIRSEEVCSYPTLNDVRALEVSFMPPPPYGLLRGPYSKGEIQFIIPCCFAYGYCVFCFCKLSTVWSVSWEVRCPVMRWFSCLKKGWYY
jgi:hypothetical protein